MAQRERLAPVIRRRAVAIGVGAASVREIDQLNIYHATHLAMRRAIARVGGHEHVLVDGNRIAGSRQQVGPYTNIVDGDAKVYSIACASVVAKVVRDRMMEAPCAPATRATAGSTTRDMRRAIIGRDPRAGADTVPPSVVPRPAADARRRPAGPVRGGRGAGRRGRDGGRGLREGRISLDPSSSTAAVVHRRPGTRYRVDP